MNYPLLFRILGILLMVFSVTAIPPIVLALVYSDGDLLPFLAAFLINFVSGLGIWLIFHDARGELRVREGFLLTVLFWGALGAVGSIPLSLSAHLTITYTDAFFESMSGLTTTGATVLSDLDLLPRSILFYRQELQWLGGMGIIVLALAILPMLGIGGMQLFKAETPGPVKDSKLTPRIKDTAKFLWYIYVSITVACALLYRMAGMSWFDAISHSFTTVSTAGFSTHDASIGYFDNPTIEMICILFMIIGSANFALHFVAWRNLVPGRVRWRRLGPDMRRRLQAYQFRERIGNAFNTYLKDDEFRFFLLAFGSIAALCSLTLILASDYAFLDSLRHALFMTISLGTTTGFGTEAFSEWPRFLPYLLLFAGIIGGCAGSTTGGFKVIRVLLVIKQGFREMALMLHPNALIRIKLGGRAVPEKVLSSVWGFLSVHVLIFNVCLLLLLATNVDFITAFSTTIACMNNIGPALGDAASHYGSLPDISKWILSLAMLFGRLEFFTLLMLLTPEFWRR